MAKVYIETYGCTLNQADSDIMRAMLKGKHELVEREEDCDVIVLNTCTVKGATENKITERIRRLREGGRKLVIAGCMSANEGKLRKLAPLAPILGTSSLKYSADAVRDAIEGKASTIKVFDSKDGLPKLLTAPICRIPINDGCLSSCHFCQTKLARPYLRSYSQKTVVKWMNDAVRGGAREIQLTSMDSGAYGADIRTNLVSLLENIADDDSDSQPGADFLIRLGMINPDHAKRMLPGIIRALRGPKFYKFLHVPVQSGSEKVCREMNRDHTAADFAEIAAAVRAELPDATIATDIIVGYPTETEDDFRETLRLLRDTKPEIANLSRFSPRPGTKARELEQLPQAEIKRRSAEAAALVKELGRERRERLIGRTARVLITERGKGGKEFKGRDINYHQVVVRGFGGKLGESADVAVTGANHGSLFGDCVH